MAEASEVGSSAAGEANLAGAFWAAAAPPSSDQRTPHGVARHALAAIDALVSGAKMVSGEHSFLLADLPGHFAKGLDLGYAAPEVARGESFDERALVFTVGVLIFERLTQTHPFGSDPQQQLGRLRKGEMGAAVNQLSSIEEGLRGILIRAMGAYPEDRFTGLEQLTRELRRFVGSSPGGERPARVPLPAPGAGSAAPPPGPLPTVQNVPADQPGAEIIKLRTIDLQPIPSAPTEVSHVHQGRVSAWLRRLAPWLRHMAVPAGCAAIGAALASACFLLFGGSDEASRCPATEEGVAAAATAARTPSATRPAVEAASRPAPAEQVSQRSPTSAPSRSRHPSRRARRRQLVGVGRAVGARLRGCLRRGQTVRAGVFVNPTGRVERALIKGARLTRRAVRCAKRKLMGLQLSLRPTRTSYFEWRLRPRAGRVAAVPTRPRR
jgi:hypothetical protein